MKVENTEIEYDYLVDNLSKYIEIVESLQKDAYTQTKRPILYRGETDNYYQHNNNQPYFNASAFRERSVEGYEGYEKGKNLPFQNNIESFKYEVWAELDDDTRNSFLAYSQHHGIKTNLIDFSLNPLISLYFAVESYIDNVNNNKRINTEKPGYVYILDVPVLDVTPLFEQTGETNLLDIITTKDKDLLDMVINLLGDFSKDNNEFLEQHFYLLCQDYYRNAHDDENEELVIEKGNDEDLVSQIVEKIVQSEEHRYIRDFYNRYHTDGPLYLYYLIVLRGYIELKKEKFLPIGREFSGAIPMVYKPIMNFKRGTNQNGIFLYQNYTVSPGGFLLDTQLIKPTKIIKVENKGEIIRSLDNININSKFIYGDHSSIAQYIENKYQEVKRAQESFNEEYYRTLEKELQIKKEF